MKTLWAWMRDAKKHQKHNTKNKLWKKNTKKYFKYQWKLYGLEWGAQKNIKNITPKINFKRKTPKNTSNSNENFMGSNEGRKITSKMNFKNNFKKT